MQGLIYKEELLRTLKADPLYDVIADKYNIEGAIAAMEEVDAVPYEEYRLRTETVEVWYKVAKSYENVIACLVKAIGKDED